MFEALPFPLVELTPWGLLGLVVFYLMTGRLIPRATHIETVAQRDHWQGVATAALDVNTKHSNIMATQAEALRLQVEGSEMTAKIMQAIQDAAQKTAEEAR
ncbi:hypothetical protein [Arthrobacter pityocampae]|uniref:hypothetical protein n=1 Tax=Arthrobacter pityocampae TaxID=547334 RepID=UPI003736F98F